MVHAFLYFNKEAWTLHHLVAFDAVINIESIFTLAVAGSAGLALFHVSHGGLGRADPVGEDLGVTICTFVRLQVEFVAEGCLAGRFRNHIAERARLHALVAFGAVTGCGKDVFAIVAGTAGFTLGHVIHGGFSHNSFVGERFGVALFA
jgi:hypothetical protein